MHKIILYSTHCPKCRALEMKLNQVGVSFDIIDDLNVVMAYAKEKGILSAPILEIDGVAYDFNKAVPAINEFKTSL